MAVSSAPPSVPDITTVTIEDEMKRSYLDYAMSVIVARALPDVRDGLKPVHRRILYSMKVNGNEWNRGYRKSARIVGDVIGKYHPHGELAIYDAMVRMAQDFAMRLPLIDGQGNFGSMDAVARGLPIHRASARCGPRRADANRRRTRRITTRPNVSRRFCLPASRTF